MSRRAVCFIDDDVHEIQRFKTALNQFFVIGAGQSSREALDDLRSQGRKQPDLWLIDMYFPSGRLPTDAELKELHDAREEFLKAEDLFKSVLGRLGQTSKGGYDKAQEVREMSGRPFAFFTRKGTLEDAIAAYENPHLKAVSVIKKPDPSPGEVARFGVEKAYDWAFEQARRLVRGDIDRALDRSTFWAKHSAKLVSFTFGIATSIAASALWTLAARWAPLLAE